MKLKSFITSVVLSIALVIFFRYSIAPYMGLYIFKVNEASAWISGIAMLIVIKSIQLSPLACRLDWLIGIKYEWCIALACLAYPIDLLIMLKGHEAGDIGGLIQLAGSMGWTAMVRLLALQWIRVPVVMTPSIEVRSMRKIVTAYPQAQPQQTYRPVSEPVSYGTRSTNKPASFDLIREMSKAPENTLILAPSESGKGIVIGNLIAAFKASTDCSVTAIDPKGAITEDGFFAQCDRVHRFKSQELDRDGIIAETKKGWKMFQEECRTWEGIKPCFILIDEMLVIGGCFSKAKDSFLQDKIASLVSMGRSQRQFCWIATQYPQLSELGIQGGIAGQLEMLIIARRKNATLIKPWGTKYDLTRAVDFREMDGCFDDSPVDRAVYWRGEWKPMPRMENLSGFDRETNSWINGAAASSAAVRYPEIATDERGGYVSAVGGGENIDNHILDYFAAAHDRNPKTIKNLRDSSRLRDRGTVEDLTIALDRLTDDGQLTRYREGWMLTSWLDNN